VPDTTAETCLFGPRRSASKRPAAPRSGGLLRGSCPSIRK
jgi:hypothetical protein